MQNILFIGNGLNRLGNSLSWNELLNSLQEEDNEDFHVRQKPAPQKLPSTLKYEYILLSSDIGRYGISDRDSEKKVDDRQLKLKQSIARKINEYPGNEIYDRLALFPFDHYITTNYDHILDKALLKNGYEYSKGNNSESLYNIKRYRLFVKENIERKIFPIHGDINAPKSIMIDYNHYCGTVAKVNDYLKGKYSWSDKGKNTILPSMEKRLLDKDVNVYSWIDHFFLSNIYVLGFGFEWVETELWWLLDRRRRYVKEGLRTPNRIIYYFLTTQDDILSDSSSEEFAKYMLFEKLGVQYRFVDFVPQNDEDYLRAYHKALDIMQDELNRELDCIVV